MVIKGSNKEIIPEGKLVSKMETRDTNNREVLSPLTTIGSKHILMGRSIEEDPSSFQNRFVILKIGLIVATINLTHYSLFIKVYICIL